MNLGPRATKSFTFGYVRTGVLGALMSIVIEWPLVTEMGKSCTPAYKIFLYAPRSVQLVRAMENVTYGSFEHTKIVSFDNSWSEIPNLKLS